MIKETHFPSIMGILNVTPDSFSDSNIENTSDDYVTKIFLKAKSLIGAGADIIDIGGESTRPGSGSVSIEEEIKRVLPVLEKIRTQFPSIPISIDTRKYEVVKAVLPYDIQYINDISGLTYNPDIVELISGTNTNLVITHYRDHNDTHYDNTVKEVFEFLKNQIDFARSSGIKNIIADIGIGFGKECNDNLILLKNIKEFVALNVPLLLGISRKRFIGEVINEEVPKERDIATILFHTLLIRETNINIIRVHNVKFAKQLKDVYNSLQ